MYTLYTIVHGIYLVICKRNNSFYRQHSVHYRGINFIKNILIIDIAKRKLSKTIFEIN
jgi:hypothetical protein